MDGILGRASCLQLGSKFETVRWKPRPRRAVHTTSCLQSSAVLVDEVAGSDDSELWTPPQIERLYEDEYIIGVSKPGTLLVHNNKGSTLLEKQRNAFLKNLVEAQLTTGRKVSPVHRLDRPSSGVIIFSKSGDATCAAQASLAHLACIKEYLVLARGSTPDYFICDEPVNDEKGFPKSAISQCEKILDLPEARCSLLKVIIKTGRWHQIRKHLNHRAHHVVGDVQHGKGGTNRFFRENYKMRSGRIFLHAARLTFPHPLHLSKKVWTSASAIDHNTMDHQYNSSASDSELEADTDCSTWMSPTTFICEDPKTRHQLLTIRASLPADLLESLFYTPCTVSLCQTVRLLVKLASIQKIKLVIKMKKKNEFSKPSTSERGETSNARQIPRNPCAVEPEEFVDMEKVCLFCKSINNCKFKYLNNNKPDQPRYQCLNVGCKKLFPLVLHNRPLGRTYGKKRGEDPEDLQGLTKTCPHCGAIDNATFKYWNNFKLRGYSQPRFKCLNADCQKQFQMRRVVNADGSESLINTSQNTSQNTNQLQSFTRLLTSNIQQMQESSNDFGGSTLPISGSQMYGVYTSPNANEQQMQGYNDNDFGGGMLPTNDSQMYDVYTSPPNTNNQQMQGYNDFGGSTLPTSGSQMYGVYTSPNANEQQKQEYNDNNFGGGTLPTNDSQMYDVYTSPPNANTQQMQGYNDFGVGTLLPYGNHMYDTIDTLPNTSTSTIENDVHLETNAQVGSNGLNNYEESFRNGNIFQNGANFGVNSECEILEESTVGIIRGHHNMEGPRSMPFSGMDLHNGIYQNGVDFEPQINHQGSHAKTLIQNYNGWEVDNVGMPCNDIFLTDGNSPTDGVSEMVNTEFDANLCWALEQALEQDLEQTLDNFGSIAPVVEGSVRDDVCNVNLV